MPRHSSPIQGGRHEPVNNDRYSTRDWAEAGLSKILLHLACFNRLQSERGSKTLSSVLRLLWHLRLLRWRNAPFVAIYWTQKPAVLSHQGCICIIRVADLGKALQYIVTLEVYISSFKGNFYCKVFVLAIFIPSSLQCYVTVMYYVLTIKKNSWGWCRKTQSNSEKSLQSMQSYCFIRCMREYCIFGRWETYG